MCNGVPPFRNVVYSIVDEIFGPFPEPAAASAGGVQMTEDQLKKFAGSWKSERSRNVNRIVLDKGALNWAL